METRLVVLDIDGVCNSTDYALHRAPEDERGSVLGIDPVAVTRLNRLVQVARADVVVSSTWRFSRTTAQLSAALTERGFLGKVIGRTPRWIKGPAGDLYPEDSRGYEIQAWLDLAPDYGITVESFVILDDDTDMAHLADRLVKKSFATGLLDEHVDLAIAMLSEPMPLIVVPSSHPR